MRILIRVPDISSEYGLSTPIAKFEVIVHDDKVDLVVDTILSKAKTAGHGAKGDGIIAVSPVDEIISVRTGKKGAQAL